MSQLVSVLRKSLTGKSPEVNKLVVIYDQFFFCFDFWYDLLFSKY